MEVDPDSALEEFRELVKGALGPPADPNAKSGGGMMGNMGLPDFKGEISEMLSGQIVCLLSLSILPLHYCTVLYCTVPNCSVMSCTVMYCTVLCRTALHCTLLYSAVSYCTVLRGDGS
jgi:hypothetical protein